MQETITALKSVMSKNDLVEFMALPSKEKMESLNGLRDIVCGIRVFNQDAGHCGDGILDSKLFSILLFSTLSWGISPLFIVLLHLLHAFQCINLKDVSLCSCLCRSLNATFLSL